MVDIFDMPHARFGDETHYDRHISPFQQPERATGQMGRLLRVFGVWQIQNHPPKPSLLRCYGRLLEVLMKPVIPMSTCFFMLSPSCGLWALISRRPFCSKTPRAAGGYGFSATTLGYIYFTPVAGIVIGELFGHWFNDFIAARYIRRHHGVFVPEARLWTPYIGASLMIPGLVLVGQTLQSRLLWVGLVFGWALVQVGIMLISVAIVTYVLDCYPNASGEVSALINLGRVAAGFSVGYFQQAWGTKVGYNVSFGVQAAVIAGSLAVLFCIQQFGAKFRLWAGPVRPL